MTSNDSNVPSPQPQASQECQDESSMKQSTPLIWGTFPYCSLTQLPQVMDSIYKEVVTMCASMGSRGTWTCTIKVTKEFGDKVKVQTGYSFIEYSPTKPSTSQ